MKQVALVTYDGAPDLPEDDRLLFNPLRGLGVEATAVVWSDPSIEWSQFDLVVLRATWDYHLRFAEFTGWIDLLERSGVRLANDYSLVRWNMRKTYLRELGLRGVPIVPTAWIERGAAPELSIDGNFDELVIKPVISADGYQTFRISRSELPTLGERIHESGAMVQPFCPEIVEEGEWSLVFLDGVYSHSLLKKPRAGEFRVQETWGGGPTRAEASRRLIDSARMAISAVPSVPLYARVDGVRRGDQLLLIELELIEPALYLEFGDGSADRFATAIARRVGQG